MSAREPEIGEWECILCGGPLARNRKCERLSQMCDSCIAENPDEFAERWEAAQTDEQFETRYGGGG